MSEFYKGFRKENVSTQGAVALQAPSTQGAQRDNAVRTQLLTQSIDSLVSAGTAAVGAADRKIKQDRAQKGAIEAGTGKDNSAGMFTWGGAEQTAAYNKVRGEAAVRDMPSYVDNFMRNDPENAKPFDEMTTEERNVAYARARQSFFKERGIEGSPFQTEAALLANQVQESHLKYMDKQAADLRQSKSETLLQQSMSAIMGTTGGRADEVESQLNSRMNEFSKMVGGTQKAQELIARGLLNEVTSDDPMRSTAALAYLKSDQARSRFSDFKDYDQVVQQAETFNQKAKNAMMAERRTEDEMGFYRYLSTGGFATEEQVNGYLDNTILDEKLKFNLRNKAMAHIKVEAEAANLRGAYFGRQPEIVNSADPKAREALFSQMIGGPDKFDLRKLGDNPESLKQENALVQWINDGYQLPDWVKAFGSADVFRSQNSNGSLDAFEGHLKVYSRIQSRVGQKGVSAIFDPEMQAKLEYYGKLRNDARYSKNDVDLIQRLEEFDQLTRRGADGSTKRAKIQEEIRTLSGDIEKWAKEGGSNIFAGPDDLQPFWTFSDMSSKPDSIPSFDHAKETIAHNYLLHRASGLDEKRAFEKAKDNFRDNYQWATWDQGSAKNSYIPKEFGTDFVPKAYRYLEDQNVYKKIAIQQGITEEEAKRGITVQPAPDYLANREVQVYFNGVAQNVRFTAQDFHNNSALLDAQELQQVLEADERMRNDGTFEENQSTLMKMRQLWDGFGF